MPLIHVYYPESLLTQDIKDHIAEQFTQIYIDSGLPAFYVNVFFQALPKQDYYISGLNATTSTADAHAPRFVRFVFEHLARAFPDRRAEVWFMNRVDSIIKPLFGSKGWAWEYHIYLGERRLWRIESLVPPWVGSATEGKWKRENKASYWEGAEEKVAE